MASSLLLHANREKVGVVTDFFFLGPKDTAIYDAAMISERLFGKPNTGPRQKV